MGCDREDLPRRLRRLDAAAVCGVRVLVARSFRARLLGLAWLREVPRDCVLLIPGCRSVHTFGMRFAIDVTFVDGDGRELRTARAVRPGRVVGCREAAAVVERPAGAGPMPDDMRPSQARDERAREAGPMSDDMRPSQARERAVSRAGAVSGRRRGG